IRKSPGIEKCLVRWGRALPDRAPDEPQDELEFEMEVYLAFDAPDDDENLRRKLHNLGHRGETVHTAMASLHAALGKGSAPLDMDALRSTAGDHHDAAQPVESKTKD